MAIKEYIKRGQVMGYDENNVLVYKHPLIITEEKELQLELGEEDELSGDTEYG